MEQDFELDSFHSAFWMLAKQGLGKQVDDPARKKRKVRMTRRRTFFIFGAVLLGMLLLGSAAFFGLRILCAEPGVRMVPSVSEDLHAHSILAVFAHPDDEILAAGMLSVAVKRGVVVRSITATRGEAGKMDPPICRPEDLGIIREAELRKFGFLLGLKSQEVWDFPDSKLPEVPIEELTNRLVSRIRTLKPDLVLTFDPSSGFTMNRDHMTIGRATTDAFLQSGGAGFEPALGASYSPASLVYLLAPPRAMRTLGGKRGQEVAANQMAPQFGIRIDPLIKISGWKIHESQATYLRRQWKFSPSILYRFLDREYYAKVNDSAKTENQPAHVSTAR